ncbi:MAG: hypothetical protein II497_02810 [Lachnospiraceae bacterium]|nr:hypothetical protein [Lachnospiraceae bacterium]
MNLRTYLKGLGLGIFVTTLITSVSSGNAKATMSDAEIRARAEELGMVSENALLLSQAQKLADDAAEKAKAAVSTDKAASGASGNKVSGNAVSGNKNSGNKISGNKISANKVSGNTVSGNTGSSAALKAGSKEDKTAGGSNASASGSIGSSSGSSSGSRKSSSDSAASSGDSKEASQSAAGKKETVPEMGSAAKKSDTASDDAGVVPGSGETVTITVSSGDSSVSVANKMVQAGLVTDAKQFDSYLVLNGFDRRLVVGSHPIPKGATPEEMGSILTSKQ